MRVQKSYKKSYETTENLYKIIIKGIHQAAKETFDTKESRPKRRNLCWNDQLQAVKEQNQKLYHRRLGAKNKNIT